MELRRNTQETDLSKKERLSALIDRAELDEDLHTAAYLALEWNTDTLPYHNSNHMFVVATGVLDLCEQQGVSGRDKQALFLAALWHDAGYKEPLTDNFTSKEQRSALLAYEAIMGTCDIEQFSETILFAEQVAGLILATNVDHGPGGRLGIILNTADLANLSQGTTAMLNETGALFLEKLMLEGIEIADLTSVTFKDYQDQIDGWVKGAQDYVRKLVTLKMDPKSQVYVAALENIKKMTASRLLSFFRSKED